MPADPIVDPMNPPRRCYVVVFRDKAAPVRNVWTQHHEVVAGTCVSFYDKNERHNPAKLTFVLTVPLDLIESFGEGEPKEDGLVYGTPKYQGPKRR